jgi:hypothetical protein
MYDVLTSPLAQNIAVRRFVTRHVFDSHFLTVPIQKLRADVLQFRCAFHLLESRLLVDHQDKGSKDPNRPAKP